MSGAHLLQNGLGVAEHLPAGRQLLLFFRLQRGGFDLVHLKAQQLHAPLLFRFVHLQSIRLTLNGDELTIHLAVLIVLLFVLGVEIQQRQMAGGIGQVLVIVLAMDIDEARGQIPQHGRRGGHTVDPEVAFALGADFTVEQQFVPCFVTGLLQLAAHSLGQVGESGPDTGLGRAGAHQFAAGAVAQDGVDGVDQNAFARTGLAGENVQAARELCFGLFDDRHILDFQIFQQSPSAPFFVFAAGPVSDG